MRQNYYRDNTNEFVDGLDSIVKHIAVAVTTIIFTTILWILLTTL